MRCQRASLDLTVSELQTTLEALSSPVRREILWRIWDEELKAGEIAAAFRLSAPTISAHLAVLRQAELVHMRVDGTARLYRAQRAKLRNFQTLLVGESSRWTPADDLPEADLSLARTGLMVLAAVETSVAVEDLFRAFDDDRLYSAWLGVEVTLRERHFAATMEWGTRVRGFYDVVVPPELIAFRWDFADDATPVPGAEMAAYLRFTSTAEGSRVEVHQLVGDESQAAFMQVAWGMVFGRLKAGVDAALRSEPVPPRVARPKRRLG